MIVDLVNDRGRGVGVRIGREIKRGIGVGVGIDIATRRGIGIGIGIAIEVGKRRKRTRRNDTGK